VNKILITGVGGFIASSIAKKFIKNNYKVIGVDDFSNGNFENVPPQVKFYFGDLADKDFYSKLPNDINIILHLAGQSSGEISFDDPVSDLNKNTVSTLNLIEFGIKCKVKKFLYASSMSVYGNIDNGIADEESNTFPLSCYGVSKLSSEFYLKIYKSKIPYIIFRMFNVYGPGQDMNNDRQGMASIFIASALNHKKIIVKGSLDRFRDFIYIDDVVNAWYQATINNKIINEIINLGTGIKTSVKELTGIIIKYLPNTEISVSNPTPGDQNGIYSNNTKLEKLLKITNPTKLEDGIKFFIEWAKNIK